MADKPQIQRSYTHDYKSPCIYMLTVTVEGREPLLGKLVGDVSTAHIELSLLGEAVRYELYALCQRYPQLRLLQYQVMPDHVHVIIQVTTRLQKPLGNLLSSWKIACGQRYGRMKEAAGASAPTRDNGTVPEATGASAPSRDKGMVTEITSIGEEGTLAPLSGVAVLAPAEGKEETGGSPFRRLFTEGYNDRILQGKGQLQRMIDYIRDNPRRLLLKHQQSSFFNIHRSIDVAGHTMDAIGNLALLRAPLLAVHCRRHWTPMEQHNYAEGCIKASQEGSVLIGAFISKTEQTIALKASVLHQPIIHITENGFPELYKPVGQAFYSCAEGRLLQLAPWKHHANRMTISREQCNAMNTIAETIATTLNNPK